MGVITKRIYEAKSEGDGYRVLIDRLWPRGIRKEDAGLDEWLKDVAPSPGLRKEFCHDPERFDVFREHYLEELAVNAAAAKLKALAKSAEVTLLYAAKDGQFNHAKVLLEFLLSP